MIVNVFSAEESRGSFEAVHVRDLDLETPEQFQSDWEDALEKISQDDPEWNVTGTLKSVEFIPLLSVVKCPTLIMGGRYDRVCPPNVQRDIAHAIQGAKLVIFDRSGHRPFIEEPVEFFGTTGEFLRGVVRK